MRYRKLDADGDMTFGNGLLDFYIDSVEAVAQSVLTRLRLWVGEWYLDESEGTPYSQAMLGYNRSQTISPAIRDRILGTPGVTGIVSLDVVINENDRRAMVSCEINTQFGVTVVNGIL